MWFSLSRAKKVYLVLSIWLFHVSHAVFFWHLLLSILITFKSFTNTFVVRRKKKEWRREKIRKNHTNIKIPIRLMTFPLRFTLCCESRLLHFSPVSPDSSLSCPESCVHSLSIYLIVSVDSDERRRKPLPFLSVNLVSMFQSPSFLPPFLLFLQILWMVFIFIVRLFSLSSQGFLGSLLFLFFLPWLDFLCLFLAFFLTRSPFSSQTVGMLCVPRLRYTWKFYSCEWLYHKKNVKLVSY